jgi:transcriptional regulator with XRE-family HTH domain
MTNSQTFYQTHLRAELNRRKSKNPRYSSRAFSKSLGVDNGLLSRLLSGKSLLSLDLADKISKKLKMTNETRRAFILSAIEEQKCHALYLLDPTLTDCNTPQ